MPFYAQILFFLIRRRSSAHVLMFAKTSASHATKPSKMLRGAARRQRGWFDDFKLHLMVDDCGAILSFSITSGNVDDRAPVPKMTKNFIGKLFGDKGYISKKLTEILAMNDVELVTKLKKNMKLKIIALFDKILLRKRSIIETINDQLKNISQIKHSRHRSLTNCVIKVVAGLLAYSYQEKRPSLNIRVDDLFPYFAVSDAYPELWLIKDFLVKLYDLLS
ncbi:MAG: IS982 family transposase [Methylococcales bacterium]|nr:IS982 family transposase [Methylococcales bacterium]MDD5631851.1 IS982 family transposase [Methylococcales bacterium]